MAAFSVNAITSPSPFLSQPRRFSTSSSASTHFPHGSLLHNRKIDILSVQSFRPFSFNSRSRRTLMCAVDQDAKEAVKDLVQTDGLIGVLVEDNSHQETGGMLSLSLRTKLGISGGLSDVAYIFGGPKRVLGKSFEAWPQFAKRVSGEWDGFGADFTNQGKVIELPESVVPEAYREWEVKVFDWQTQCPTLADPEDRVLEYRSIQLLPTVGCEADAATVYSSDDRKVGEENSGVTAFAYQSSGSYVALWQKKDDLIELEYCLINPQNFESRVRIIQRISVINNTEMVLRGIRVYREQWYGPFRNGDQLGGCAIRDSAFASSAPMAASEVAGIWQGSKTVAAFGTTNTGIFRELLEDKIQNCVRDGDNNILLPKQLWCSLKQNKDEETQSEVGWLLDHGQAITSSCLFSSTANLKEISIALETKALEYV